MQRVWKENCRKTYGFTLTCSKKEGANILNSKEELVNFLKEQIKIEKRIVDSLNSSLGEIENPAVKGF